jgi:hypothetical protein
MVTRARKRQASMKASGEIGVGLSQFFVGELLQ